MKRTLYTSILLSSALAAFGLLAQGCTDTNAPDESFSVIDMDRQPLNAFTQWLKDSIQGPYNIDYKYQMDPTEIDHSYMLTPVMLDKSMMLAKAFKYVWLEAYNEVADISFTQANVPRVIMPIGSPAYEDNGTYTLGTAEGGLKVTFYAANQFDQTQPDELNRLFFHTMHHEFGHILHAAKAYDVRYVEISKEDYDQTTWQNRPEADAAKLGFITPYAGSNSEEDFTELAANYITMTDEKFQDVLTQAGADGAQGRAKLMEKIVIMKNYMQEAWNIDMDELHRDVQNRTAQVKNMQLILDPWQELLRASKKNGTRATLPPLKPGINNLIDVDVAAKTFLLKPELLLVPAMPSNSSQAQYAQYLKNYHNDNCAHILQLFDQPAFAKLSESIHAH